MFVNADEVPGKLAFEDNLAQGQRYTPTEAALRKASPLMRCKR